MDSTLRTDLATSGPAVTITTGTTAIVTVTTNMSNSNAGTTVNMGFAVSGATSRDKRFLIRGLSPEELRARLAVLVPAQGRS